MIHPPPRLLLGTALLFWGAMIGWPLVGLGVAVVVEASHWLRLRWDFNDDSLTRSWRLSVMAIAVTAAMILIDGERYTALPSLISWLPALLLPVQFIQSYGMRDSIPLSEFSVLARQQRKRNERFGLPGETRRFNFGNVLFVTALVAATVGEHSRSQIFLPAMVTLAGWRLMHGASRAFLLPLLACVGALALAGEFGLRKLSDWVGAGLSEIHYQSDPDFNSTMIGTSGSVRQSADIVWRVKPDPGSPAPALLRTNTFNLFLSASWRNANGSSDERTDVEAVPTGDQLAYRLRPEAAAAKPWNPASFTLRGTMKAEAPLPLPGDVAELKGFDFRSIGADTYGRVHVLPKEPVISGTVVWRGACNPEGPPEEEVDLRVPKADKATLEKIVAELGLAGMDRRRQVIELRRWFHTRFTYTRDLTIRRPAPKSGKASALSQFLTTVRAGHCEYFATAAVMLLREAGVPARYAVGYSVCERNAGRGEFVIRGTHGHAWCRYWDAEAGLWMDFDATPPDWSQSAGMGVGWGQRLSDWFTRLREDFFLWRNQSAVQMGITVATGLFGVVVGAVVLRRLWRSRRTIRPTAGARWQPVPGQEIRTPLHALEKKSAALLGPRPTGVPYARWLEHLAPRLADPACLHKALALHQRLRFDPVAPAPGDREDLARLARLLAADLKKNRRKAGPSKPA